ncbi:hypothetical protein KY290_031937 [Solanum tuberosum]|uniref:Late embryogenesis abundant protein LEA-2 subgroup domain-containing protein n=1 Tax=Solanum tuberosum TaxID=4113 RepID=A0ABQ7UCD8_SOLTU|nr:hypothetical protein KY289_031348 [Solanum tuberosum]KAH0656334.1 hypothetical protein KY285_031216 [Solanum tuberosum]KAH0743944.1 hypothetical protein KY290_031937 [Solanum tuberosum]
MGEYGRPPPYGGEYYYTEKRRGGNFCVRCICCCYCVLFLLIIILASIAFYFYMYYKPKIPTYDFQSLDVKDFGYQPDFSVNADLILTMKANNPNTAIGFIYGEGSSVNVTYSDSNICTGKLPSFHQGLYEAFQENEKNGKIPLKPGKKPEVEHSKPTFDVKF